ncbi:DNA-binding protein [Variovorax sp. 3P27G3]|jgi:DNA repair exonuclease SbcCD ATPase subunit|uniref:DNA-binding protein n=1 Tax=Variovorax sp. 3P27G3 TaxID=2502214 RepID=UPI0010FA5830|nr:DNA-binding protein [Variovorax sp. 3P27G3]
MESKSWRGIQEADVWSAADQLLTEGLRPTIERVRQQIGRGSPNTVSPMLERWFATLGKRLDHGSDKNLPPGAEDERVPVVVMQAAQTLWDLAREDAAKTQIRQAEALRNETEERTASLNARQAELAQKEAALEHTRSGLESALASARQALDSSQAQLEVTTRGRHESEARARQLERSLEQAQASQERQRLEFTAQQAAWSETARQSEQLNAEREKRLLLEVDRERMSARQANGELLKERKLRERTEESLNEATRNLTSVRSELILIRATQVHSQDDIRALQERRDELQKRISNEEQAHQATRALLSTALAPRSKGKRSVGS